MQYLFLLTSLLLIIVLFMQHKMIVRVTLWIISMCAALGAVFTVTQGNNINEMLITTVVAIILMGMATVSVPESYFRTIENR